MDLSKNLTGSYSLYSNLCYDIIAKKWVLVLYSIFVILIAMNANKNKLLKRLSYESPRDNAVRCEASVRRGEPRFAEPTWVVGKAQFGISYISIRRIKV